MERRCTYTQGTRKNKARRCEARHCLSISYATTICHACYLIVVLIPRVRSAEGRAEVSSDALRMRCELAWACAA